MSASLSILRRAVTGTAAPAVDVARDHSFDEGEQAWDPQQFAHEQIRGMVRRVFLQGWPRPARQVVFSAASRQIEIASLCRRAGEALAAEGAGRVSLVEANFQTPALEQSFGGTSNDGSGYSATAGALRKSSRQIAHNLWLVPVATFLGCAENGHNAAWLRSRLGELRREFDFAVIHALPTDVPGGSAAFLATLVDGLVLALEAHRTRRLAAMRIREQLSAANVRLLGVVLRGRSFPIPERLYRKL